MPKINELPRASSLAATDLLAKDNTSGTSTEGVSATQIANFVKGTIPAPDSTPISGSTNTVTSGGVAATNEALGTRMAAAENVINDVEGGSAGQVLRKKTAANFDFEWASVGQPTDEQTAEAVSAWLDAHPEATTTVQDESITYHKFANDVQQKFFLITPDNYTGTDTEKIQSAFDSFGQRGCGTIVINRSYTITSDIIIKHQTFYGINNRITVIGLGRDAVINMGSHSFVGVSTNPDTRNYGGITFENIHFEGTAVLFDFTYLIRICLLNCSIEKFAHVVYSTRFIQSIQINMCLLRDCTDTIIYSYGQTAQNAIGDVVVTGSLIERCNKVLDVFKADGVVFDKNCIEASHGLPFKISGYSGNIVISGNYFESNNSAYNDGDIDGNGVTIDMSNIAYTQSVAIINNFFAQRSADTVIILPDVSGVSGTIEIRNNGAARICNLINASQTLTTPYRKIIVGGNFGDIVDPNNLLASYDAIKEQSATYTVTSAGQTITGSYTFKRVGKTVFMTGTATLTQVQSGTKTILPSANYPLLYRPDAQYQHVAFDNTSGNAVKIKWSSGRALQAEIPSNGDYEIVFEISYPSTY